VAGAATDALGSLGERAANRRGAGGVTLVRGARLPIRQGGQGAGGSGNLGPGKHVAAARSRQEEKDEKGKMFLGIKGFLTPPVLTPPVWRAWPSALRLTGLPGGPETGLS